MTNHLRLSLIRWTPQHFCVKLALQRIVFFSLLEISTCLKCFLFLKPMCFFFFFLSRPLRTQSSAGTRATSAETTPSQPRPVTAAVLPSQPTGGDAAASSASGASASSRVQLSDLQNILSTMTGECLTAVVRKKGQQAFCYFF